MSVTYRKDLDRPLTPAEVDANFKLLDNGIRPFRAESNIDCNYSPILVVIPHATTELSEFVLKATFSDKYYSRFYEVLATFVYDSEDGNYDIFDFKTSLLDDEMSSFNVSFSSSVNEDGDLEIRLLRAYNSDSVVAGYFSIFPI